MCELTKILKTLSPILTIALMCGCSRSGPPVRSSDEACSGLAVAITEQEQVFVARVKAIRGQHILLRDYDRLMIAALTDRRSALQSLLRSASSRKGGSSTCSGEPLDDLHLGIQREIGHLDDYIKTFTQALNSDSADKFIDSL
jgi:hypothetical protein